MSAHLDTERIEQEAQRILNGRMDVIRELAKSRHAVTEAQQALAAAENEDARRYQAALTAGWTPEELKKVGFTEPAKKQRVTRRARRQTPAASDTAAAPPEAATI